MVNANDYRHFNANGVISCFIWQWNLVCSIVELFNVAIFVDRDLFSEK